MLGGVFASLRNNDLLKAAPLCACWRRNVNRMRLKLLVIAALLASLVGTCAVAAINYWLLDSPRPLISFDLAALGALLVPALAIGGASFFVYRHTSRRRKLQAMATALLGLLLTLAALVVLSMVLAARLPTTPPPPTPVNIG